MKPISLFGWGINAYSPVVSRQKRLNCFYDIRDDRDKQAIIVRGTPGVIGEFVLGNGPIRGWHVANGVLYAVSGHELYSVLTNGTITFLANLVPLSTSGIVSLGDNGVQLMIVDGQKGYIYTLVTGSYIQSALNAAGSFGIIADANFPNGATSVAFLDGRFIVNRPNTRQYYCSEQYDGTGWTNASLLPTFATKDNYSDLLISVWSLNGLLVLYGELSIEFWQDIGSAPLPFARVNGATQNWGTAAPYSPAYLNNTILFLGQSSQGGGVQVLALNGYAVQRVSTTDIENIISTFPTWQDAISFGYIIDGHSMYQITFPSAKRSFLYDLSTNFWSEMQSGLGLLGRHIANLGITFNTFNYVSDSLSGTVYKLDSEVYTDNGQAIKRQITSRHVGMGGNRFGIDEVYLDMETGVGLQSGQGSDPQIMMQVSKDGGRTFGPERWKPIGKVGQYKSPRVIWNRMGASQDFVFQWTMTDPVKFTVIGGACRIRQAEGVNE